MATLKLINMRIETSSRADARRLEGQDGPQEFFAAGAISTLNPNSDVIQIRNFNQDIVKMWKKRLPKFLKGDLEIDEADWDEEKAIPARKRYLTNIWMEKVDLGGAYCSLRSSAVVDSDGNVIEGMEAGSVVCKKNGKPKVWTTVMVPVQAVQKMAQELDEFGFPKFKEVNGEEVPLVKPIFDKETGEPVYEGWVSGMSPEEQKQARIGMMITYKEACEKLGLSPDGEDELPIPDSSEGLWDDTHSEEADGEGETNDDVNA